MILKKLEIAGFKSFGKPVTLDFSSAITAVVGPNGSGKSNVAEALRWVLGEQSLKSLRTKRGDDLIFHGSDKATQLGKARVAVVFDNARRIFSVDFSEVVVSREVYRDGINEYRLNDSQIRLKDVVELMSNVGIGGSSHHIISQGEADRILYASSKERREMLEDALGLRIYQIKRAEAERKLTAAEENMREVQLLRREIQPHLKFLETQVQKIEASCALYEELKMLLGDYFVREEASIKVLERSLEAKEKPLRAASQVLEETYDSLRKNLSTRTEQAQLEEKRRALERELGRVEGQLAVLAVSSSKRKSREYVSVGEVTESLRAVSSLLQSAAGSSSLSEIQRHIKDAGDAVARLLALCCEEHADVSKDNRYILLEKEKDRLAETTARVTEEQRKVLSEKNSLEKELREKERELFEMKDALRGLDKEWDYVHARSEDLQRDKEEYGYILEGITISSAALPDSESPADWESVRQARKRDIQHLKLKWEDSGGVDPAVTREYEETTERDRFLSRELDDLEGTKQSLMQLLGELAERLQKEFSDGMNNINREFGSLFRSVFDGGNAKLVVRNVRVEGEGEDTEEAGIDIAIDMPRKRVKNLDMLSGGERALTSIALLFAMALVNPPPFLVLDETDAALDEANSQRYGVMLRNLSGKTQLIVITHNRTTMKEAGILYGVTMGADGLSRLLSVKFGELEL